MIKIIKESECPEPLLRHLLSWQMTLSEAVNRSPFNGIDWQGVDKNMLAHNSKEAYIAWFCSPPPYNEPYRDGGFYARELTMLSSWARPDNIVEMGTNLGMGTRLLSYLNPESVIVTIDDQAIHKHEGDKDYPVGYLIEGRHRIIMREHKSWDYVSPGIVDLCFNDADHTAESVKKDNETAWLNKSINHKWAIIWHDYNLGKEGLKGYCAEIERFLEEKEATAYRFEDSFTLWTYGGE